MFPRKDKTPEEDRFLRDREDMVKYQLVPRGITSKKVLDVFLKVRRDQFINEGYKSSSYADHPLPTGCGQTISQPYMVALMTECLELSKDDKVLEIGTGSGYQTAILAELAKEVYSVERFDSLASEAGATLKKLGYDNITITVGDGTLGWEEFAPYDKIIVTAGAVKIPPALEKQLAEGGKMVIPVGNSFTQMLILATKEKGTLKTEDVCPCVFVPLVGKNGWRE